MSTAVVFLDIEKVFDTTWHLGLLYKLSELKFLISLIKIITFFFLKDEDTAGWKRGLAGAVVISKV
jgi:hypothetical protein